MNFSDWGEDSDEGEDTVEQLQKGSMPSDQYQPLHPEARLSGEEWLRSWPPWRRWSGAGPARVPAAGRIRTAASEDDGARRVSSGTPAASRRPTPAGVP
jgi:hypothetical protein